ncbi:hypothetical protein Agsp01_35600 [Agromyces sp. NBRC 114283]|nr:hypothetical protein Agsp01_35600 [Agromyces sp. NBRC 114283]
MDDTALDLIETTASVRDVALPPAPPVAASTATGSVPSVLPRRHRRLSWTARQWRKLRGGTR